MPTTEYAPYAGTHKCSDIDDAIDRSIANATAIATKQDALTTAQLAAVNSGIDSTKTAAIASNTAAIATKQDALTTAQLAAVNSGIDSTKVAAIATNTNDISGLSEDMSGVETEIESAKTGADGTEYDTLSERLDAETDAAHSGDMIMSLYDLTVGTQDENGTVHKDVIASAVFREGVTLSQEGFIASTVYDYLSNTAESATAKVSNPIRVRNFDGTQIADIDCNYAPSLQSGNIGFGFKKDGTHDIKYNASNVVNGKIVFSNDTYYFVILKYTTVDLTMTCEMGSNVIDSITDKLAFTSLADIEDMTVMQNGSVQRDIIAVYCKSHNNSSKFRSVHNLHIQVVSYIKRNREGC